MRDCLFHQQRTHQFEGHLSQLVETSKYSTLLSFYRKSHPSTAWALTHWNNTLKQSGHVFHICNILHISHLYHHFCHHSSDNLSFHPFYLLSPLSSPLVFCHNFFLVLLSHIFLCMKVSKPSVIFLGYEIQGLHHTFHINLTIRVTFFLITL